jgi:hypothetical protein
MGLVFSGHGRWLLACDNDQSRRLYDLAAPDSYASSVSLRGTQFDHAAFSPDGRWVLLANSGRVQFWPLAEVDLMGFAGMLVGETYCVMSGPRAFPSKATSRRSDLAFIARAHLIIRISILSC